VNDQAPSNQAPASTMNVIVQNNATNALGIASFVLGLLSIFFLAPIFVPIALVLGIIAIIKKQLVWGIIGVICAIIGALTSPILLGMLGITSFFANA
jgi:hypothetical protein